MTTGTLLSETTSLCARCKRSLDAELHRVDGQVFMRKECPRHGEQEVVVAGDADWYEHVMSFEPVLSKPRKVMNDVEQGCPFDCGACGQHEQAVQLPIVPITSACNLSCPICYTHNKNDGAYHMSEEELRGILEQLRELTPGRRIINLTGGEPTQHPDFVRLVELCHEEGVNRITISTHGMRFVKEESVLERLADMDARIILSFDSFDDPTNKAMLGGNFTSGKLRVLELLEKHDVNTTLLPVLAADYNVHEIGEMLDLALRKDFIRSVEFHTMTFTGQFGRDFDRRARYTAYDALKDIEEQSDGMLRIDDFVPSPSAHPMCYQVAYVMKMGDRGWLPMTRFMTPRDMRELLGGTLYLQPDARTERKLADVINRLWAGELESEHTDEVLEVLRSLVDRLFAPDLSPLERMRISEQSTKAVYVHAHMDEETFDTDRIRQCCVGIVGPDGSNIPSCSYNTLYRERDERFMAVPGKPMEMLGEGRK